MRKNSSPVYIDELMLNVLGAEFFKKREIQTALLPATPKKKIHSEPQSLKDVS